MGGDPGRALCCDLVFPLEQGPFSWAYLSLPLAVLLSLTFLPVGAAAADGRVFLWEDSSGLPLNFLLLPLELRAAHN